MIRNDIDALLSQLAFLQHELVKKLPPCVGTDLLKKVASDAYDTILVRLGAINQAPATVSPETLAMQKSIEAYVTSLGGRLHPNGTGWFQSPNGKWLCSFYKDPPESNAWVGMIDMAEPAAWMLYVAASCSPLVGSTEVREFIRMVPAPAPLPVLSADRRPTPDEARAAVTRLTDNCTHHKEEDLLLLYYISESEHALAEIRRVLDEPDPKGGNALASTFERANKLPRIRIIIDGTSGPAPAIPQTVVAVQLSQAASIDAAYSNDPRVRIIVDPHVGQKCGCGAHHMMELPWACADKSTQLHPITPEVVEP